MRTWGFLIVISLKAFILSGNYRTPRLSIAIAADGWKAKIAVFWIAEHWFY
jgi:hypothetical protein